MGPRVWVYSGGVSCSWQSLSLVREGSGQSSKVGELGERGGERSGGGSGRGWIGRQREKREEARGMLFVTTGQPEKGRQGAGAWEGQRWERQDRGRQAWGAGVGRAAERGRNE